MVNKTAAQEPAQAATGWSAIRSTWSDRRRWEAVAVAAVPPLVFAITSSLGAPLLTALTAALATSAAGAAYRLVRKDRLRSALIGLGITMVCVAVASFTGEARGFFLLPAAVPFVVIAICVVTLAINRPLTGIILNRVSGGPADWPERRRILRVHQNATLVAIAINAVNATIQVVFYTQSDTVVLAVAHIATGPLFASLVAVTLVAARRAVMASR